MLNLQILFTLWNSYQISEIFSGIITIAASNRKWALLEQQSCTVYVKDEKKTKWRRMNRVAFVICALRCIQNENIIILSIISVWRNATEIFNIQRTERPRSVCVGAIALEECLFELLSLSLSRMMNALNGCFATDYYCFSSSKWVSVCNVSVSLQHSCFFRFVLSCLHIADVTYFSYLVRYASDLWAQRIQFLSKMFINLLCSHKLFTSGLIVL